MPVTTASGKLTGGTGVGLGEAVGVGWGVGVAVAVGLGVVLEHPTSSDTIAATVSPRQVAVAFTAVSYRL
jgi:hypothetical protein